MVDADDRRRLLLAMLAEKRPAAAEVPAAAPGPPRLTPLQEQLWLFENIRPGTAAYNVAAATELHGPLDRSALRTAIAAVVQRHEALRMVVDDTAEGPRLKSLPPERDSWSWTELDRPPGLVDPAVERSWFESAMADHAAEALDLGTGP